MGKSPGDGRPYIDLELVLVLVLVLDSVVV
jgi:hypothetical protein